MDPATGMIIGSAIAGGSSAFGSWMGARSQADADAASYRIWQEQKEFSDFMADKQNNFSERMSSSAWQRGVDDMRKAGINPMLAVSQGGASSPSGAGGSTPAFSGFSPASLPLAAAVASALDAVRTIAGARKDVAAADNTKADTALKILESDVVPYRVKLLAAQTAQSVASAKSMEATIPVRKYESDRAGRASDFESRHPRTFGVLDSVLKRLPLFNSAYKVTQ